MTILTYRPIKSWPAGWDREKPPSEGSAFTATWTSTLTLLDRELTALRVTEATLQVDAPSTAFRIDGALRADARLHYPGVILAVVTKRHGTLTYPCNRFGGQVWRPGNRGSTAMPGWQENVRAIALGLEALRKVDRYGIAERGQQYAGWAELPAGIPMGRVMSVEEAMEFLRIESEWDGEFDPLLDRIHIDVAFRMAAKRLHPDAGGEADAFRKLSEAKELLERTVGLRDGIS